MNGKRKNQEQNQGSMREHTPNAEPQTGPDGAEGVGHIVDQLVSADDSADWRKLECHQFYVDTRWKGDIEAAAAGYKADPTWRAIAAKLKATGVLDAGMVELDLGALLLDARLPVNLRRRLTPRQRKALMPVRDNSMLAKLAQAALDPKTEFGGWMGTVALQLHRESGRDNERYFDWHGAVFDLVLVLHHLGLDSVGLNDDKRYELPGPEISDLDVLPPEVVSAVVVHGDALVLLARVAELITEAAEIPVDTATRRDLIDLIQFEVERFFNARE